jgi:enamine deaminase RidA (YjgF/YER057c/UK114 family)
MISFDNPPGVGAPVARYSHVAIIDLGTATMLVLAGQVPVGTDGEHVGGDDFGAQARQAFANVLNILEAHGAGPADIVKTTYYVTDMANRPELSAVRDEALGDHEAASTLVEINALSSPEYLVEIDVMAVVPAGPADQTASR